MNRFVGRAAPGVAALVALVLGIVLYTTHPVLSSDHQDSPATVARPGADITDDFLFPSPSNPNNVVLVMDVHPLIATGQGLTTYFDPGVLYQMKIDNSGAAIPKENMVIQFLFDNPTATGQTFTVYGPGAPVEFGAINKVLPQAAGTGSINKAFTTSNGLQIYAGGAEDPFFFDLNQFLKILPDRAQGSTAQGCLPAPLGNNTCVGFNPPATASDTLKGLNVLTLVVELPKATLTSGGTSKIAYWVTTSTTSAQ